MRTYRLILLIALTFFLHLMPASAIETWAYLMKGEESFFPVDAPISDLACFSAVVGPDGALQGGHLKPPTLTRPNPSMRYHLVITIPWNSTLAHLYLDPKLPMRARIIEEIVARAAPFDGVQIDFESIKAEDGTAYLDFLAAVKKALPENKIFSVAVMARWQAHKDKNPNDPFDYPFISMIADRVIVMAYDEHYRGGSPGPIASLPWCAKIHDYATKNISKDKLVMGIPLYGRGWQASTLAKAYKHREVMEELDKRSIAPVMDRAAGGSFTFEETVTVKVHFETLDSLSEKMRLYRSQPIKGVAYWRIGQEPAGFWEALRQQTGKP